MTRWRGPTRRATGTLVPAAAGMGEKLYNRVVICFIAPVYLLDLPHAGIGLSSVSRPALLR